MGREKQVKRYTIGSVNKENLNQLMQKEDFNEFRDRVQRFDFSPCSICGGCDLAETNEEDFLATLSQFVAIAFGAMELYSAPDILAKSLLEIR